MSRLDKTQLATILAALRFYRDAGMGDPANRSDEIHDIATDHPSITASLDYDGIEELEEQLREELDSDSEVPQNIHAMVADDDGDTSVVLRATRQLAIEAALDALDDFPEHLREPAKTEMRNDGYCRVAHNLGHTFQVVEISERHSLVLALRASEANAEDGVARASHERQRG